MRLDKWLADAGVGTRSEVKNYIRKKQVLVNDLPVTDPGFQVTEQDSICYQSRQIGQKGNVYYMFHKPAGCVSATEDAGRTVLDYFPEAERKHLILCGRLDKDTEGFLIVTNDGMFSHRLMSPRHHVDKTYYFEAEISILACGGAGGCNGGGGCGAGGCFDRLAAQRQHLSDRLLGQWLPDSRVRPHAADAAEPDQPRRLYGGIYPGLE